MLVLALQFSRITCAGRSSPTYNPRPGRDTRGASVLGVEGYSLKTEEKILIWISASDERVNLRSSLLRRTDHDSAPTGITSNCATEWSRTVERVSLERR